MRNLSVNIENSIYQISLEQDRTFLINENGKAIGNIYPSRGRLKLIWKCKGQMENKLVKELGKCIESHQVSSQVL